MKRKLNRIMIVCMLIGLCVSPSILKSQSVEPTNSISLFLNSDTGSNFNSWFSFNHFFDSDWSSDEKEAVKADSLRKELEIESKVKSSNELTIPKSKRDSLNKLRKKNFRNMPVVIQTRI